MNGLDKAFINLRVGVKIFRINDLKIPAVECLTVDSIRQMEDGTLFVSCGDSLIETDNPESSNNGSYYTDKKDCEAQLEKICIARIVALSKVIGSLS